MNVYKIISTAAALGIIIAGCVYLFAGAQTLIFVLFTFAVLLFIMGAAGVLEQRKAKSRGIAPYISSICFLVLCVAVFAAAVFRLLNP